MPANFEGPCDVLVVGGGIIGLSCARELARRGLRPAVLDAAGPESLGPSSSWAAAGMLAPLAEVGTPGPMLTACLASLRDWQDFRDALQAESQTAIELAFAGGLAVAVSEAEEKAFEGLLTTARTVGAQVDRVSRRELHRRVPDLTPAASSGLWLSEEGRVDNRAILTALERSLENLHVPLLRNHRVRNFERTTAAGNPEVRLRGESPEGPFELEAPLAVLAAGAWSRGILPAEARLAAIPRLPVRPVRGQMLRLEGIAWPFAGAIHATAGYAVRRGKDSLLLGATVEEAGFANHPTADGLGDMVEGLRRLFPTLAAAPVSELWAGLRPGTPDGLPILGRWCGHEALIVATGHFRNGILLAPWTAQAVADLVTGSRRGDLEPFSPARFAAAAELPAGLGSSPRTRPENQVPAGV